MTKSCSTSRIKKNKKSIPDKRRHQIKQEFFEFWDIGRIAKEYGIDYTYLTKYLHWPATTRHTHKWIDYRRCGVCRVYKTLDNFMKHWDYLTYDCKYCNHLVKKNKRVMRKNDGTYDDYIKKSRAKWAKNKWRYNTRRKIMRIIKYTDVNWRVILKNN